MTRKYSRDNRGRFASVGATARGGRLRTASGKKRETQTAKIKGGAASGTIGRPKGLKPSGATSKAAASAANKITSSPRQLNAKEKIARDVVSDKRYRSDRQRIAEMQRRGLKADTDFTGLVADVRAKQGGGATARIKPAARRADRAEANIPMRGARGRRLDAEITRNVNAQKAQERAADKARNRQAKTEASRAKKLRDAHIGSIAKAKGLSKGQVESALKAQPASTQIKALKNWVKVNRAAAKPAAAKSKASAPARRRGAVGKIDDAKAGRIIGRIDANRPGLRRASGSARKTANAIKTQRKAVDFALAAGARARKQGKSLSVNDSLRRAVANAAKKSRQQSKASAQDLVNASVRKNQNKKLRSLNEKIKAAGPSAAGLRLEKLALQSRMTSTRPKPSAKQQAKQQVQNTALRSRVGRLKRAQARVEATADTRNVPGSKMIRRPDAKTSRSNRRAEQARSIYLGASGSSVKNFARGVARTARAKNNWRPMRRG